MTSTVRFFSCPTLNAGSVGLVTRFGQFYKSVDPGLVQVNVCTESLRIVDVKIQISPIGRQMVMYVCCAHYFYRSHSYLVTAPGIMSTSRCKFFQDILLKSIISYLSTATRSFTSRLPTRIVLPSVSLIFARRSSRGLRPRFVM